MHFQCAIAKRAIALSLKITLKIIQQCDSNTQVNVCVCSSKLITHNFMVYLYKLLPRFHDK